MTMPQIVAVIARQAKTDDFYARLLRELKKMLILQSKDYDLLKADLESRHFETPQEVFEYFE